MLKRRFVVPSRVLSGVVRTLTAVRAAISRCHVSKAHRARTPKTEAFVDRPFLGDFEDVGKEEEAQLVALAAQLVGAAQLNNIDFADKAEKQLFNCFYFNN
jgi:hypothetical protein